MRPQLLQGLRLLRAMLRQRRGTRISSTCHASFPGDRAKLVPHLRPGMGSRRRAAARCEGAEIYGLGSWADIADHIGGYRHKDEVRDHYLDVYVGSNRFPLPRRCSPQDMELANEVSREEFQSRKKRRIEERKDAAKNAPALQPKTKPTASVPACHEIQGYMPGRLEFETEYANEAEESVQLMQFDPGDGLNPVPASLSRRWSSS